MVSHRFGVQKTVRIRGKESSGTQTALGWSPAALSLSYMAPSNLKSLITDLALAVLGLNSVLF